MIAQSDLDLLGKWNPCPRPAEAYPHSIQAVPDIGSMINAATVMITVSDDASPAHDCSQLATPADAGLGTLITNEGVWTHDHWTTAGALYGTAAKDPREASSYIKSFQCATFTGQNSSQSFRASTLDIDDTVKVGTLLIKDSQTAPNGTAIKLSSLGTSVNRNTNWVPSGAVSIHTAYVKGADRSTSRWLDHQNVGNWDLWFPLDLKDPNSKYPVDGRAAYRSQTRTIIVGDRIDQGDSGGGIFNDQGELIGVIYRQYNGVFGNLGGSHQIWE
jgi:hypothetical protein